VRQAVPGLDRRALHRLAWTVADLRAVDVPGEDEVDTALRLRSGDALPVAALPVPALGGAR
jgi:hypothetical protein